MKPIDLKILDQKLHFKQGIDATSKYTPEEKEKLANASKEFESMLTSMMIKSMTKTTDGLFGKDNFGGDVLDVLFEGEISKFITDSQGMGVAGKIYKSLTGEDISSGKNIVTEKMFGPTVANNSKPDIKVFKHAVTKPSNKAIERIKQYESFIDKASEKFRVDKKIIKSIILTESAGKVNAHSKANAKGLMQLIDSTAIDMGVQNVWDPKENIFGGTKYIAKMLKDFDGDLDLALAAYNAGPGNVRKYNGIPPFSETQKYVKRVNHYLNTLD